MSEPEDPRITEARRIANDPDTEPWRAGVMAGLLSIVEVLDGPYTPYCTCGWSGNPHQTKADAWVELWAEHPEPCGLPYKGNPLERGD